MPHSAMSQPPTLNPTFLLLQFVMTIPSSAVRTLVDAQSVVDMWDRVLDAMADLVVFSRDRPRAERIVLDCDIGGGWMHSGWSFEHSLLFPQLLVAFCRAPPHSSFISCLHAGYPIMAYLEVAPEMVTVRTGSDVSQELPQKWGFLHE